MSREIIPKIDISELINFGVQSNKSNKIIKQIKPILSAENMRFGTLDRCS